MRSFRPGYVRSRLSISSRIVPPSASTTSWFRVSFLKGVGIRTGIIIGLGNLGCLLKQGFEFFQVRADQFGLTDFVDHSLLRLQSVPGNAEDDAFVSRDPSAFN